MRSPVLKRSVVIVGHKTSISLEDAFWIALKDIARERGVALGKLVHKIDNDREVGSLSSAIRLFVLDYYQAALAAAGLTAESARSNPRQHPAPAVAVA